LGKRSWAESSFDVRQRVIDLGTDSIRNDNKCITRLVGSLLKRREAHATARTYIPTDAAVDAFAGVHALDPYLALDAVHDFGPLFVGSIFVG